MPKVSLLLKHGYYIFSYKDKNRALPHPLGGFLRTWRIVTSVNELSFPFVWVWESFYSSTWASMWLPFERSLVLQFMYSSLRCLIYPVFLRHPSLILSIPLFYVKHLYNGVLSHLLWYPPHGLLLISSCLWV